MLQVRVESRRCACSPAFRFESVQKLSEPVRRQFERISVDLLMCRDIRSSKFLPVSEETFHVKRAKL